MLPATPSWEWNIVFGAMGGAMNAWLSSDSGLLWSWTPAAVDRARRLTRLGLPTNLVIGAVAALAVALVLELSLDDSRFRRSPAAWAALAAVGGFIGLTTTRLVTNEVDKGLLRAAAGYACAAPAAHPDTVQRLVTSPPAVVYAIAAGLMPRHTVPLLGYDGIGGNE